MATDAMRTSRDLSQCPLGSTPDSVHTKAARLEDNVKFVKAVKVLKAEFAALYSVPRIQGPDRLSRVGCTV